MSLDFDLRNMPSETPRTIELDNGKVEWHPNVNCLVWYTMVLGLNEITAQNVDEWLARLCIYERVFGSFRMDRERGDVPFTRNEIVDHIGLRTNATRMSRTTFIKNVWQRVDEEVGLKT